MKTSSSAYGRHFLLTVIGPSWLLLRDEILVSFWTVLWKYQWSKKKTQW